MESMYRWLKNGKPAVGYYLRMFRKYYRGSYLPKVTYFTVDEYVNYHKNVKKYINYCEVLIDKHGRVAPAVPSHSDAVYGGDIVKKAKYMYKTRPADYCEEKLCDDFNVIMVWHRYSKIGTKLPTTQQLSALYRLYVEGCVHRECWLSLVVQMDKLVSRRLWDGNRDEGQ